MVAYSFKAQFRAPILAGTKRQTIRADRKRHARAGEQLQLYTGMRTRNCGLIGRALCSMVDPIRIAVSEGWIETPRLGRFYSVSSLDDFARADGFADWSGMQDFWRREHPDAAIFSGVLIQWGVLEP
jgi:hypothetical protein